MGSGGIICIPCFMKIGTGVQEKLMFHHKKLKVCNCGITDLILLGKRNEYKAC
jgi:hypothetical protein